MKRIRNLTCIGIALLFTISFGQGKAFGNNTARQAEALSYFKKGEALAQEGDTTQAIYQFREALRLNRKLSSAYHRLAQLYIGLGTLEDRAQAQQYLDKALYYESKNVDYLYTQLKLYLVTGFDGAAVKVLKKLLKINPKNAEAYFHLGYLEEKQWLKYHDMINPQKDDIVFSFKKFAKGDIKEAIEFYRKSIECDPEFSESYFRLALLYYEIDELDAMVSLLEEAIDYKSDNKNYYLFLGLAHHKMRRSREAAEEFAKAKLLMPPEELDLFESVDLVATPKQVKAVRYTSIDKMQGFEDAFWRSKDPLFLTEQNERKLEHYSRVAYANLRFSKPSLKGVWEGVQGWDSDMGKVYIRYGPPDSKHKVWAASSDVKVDLKGTIATAGGEKLASTTAVWKYDDFEFKFEDASRNQNYRFQWGIEGTDYNYYYEVLIRNNPEKYEYASPDKELVIACTPACFSNSEAHCFLEAYHSIPKNMLSKYRSGINNKLRRGVFVFDKSWNEIKKVVEENPQLIQHADSLLLGWERVRTRFGNVYAAVEYLDEKTGKTGRWMGEVTVPAYMKSRLEMSDLVLAWEIDDNHRKGELRKGGVRIVPNTSGVYADSASIPFYFEVYNLTYTPQGLTRYRVTTIVEPEESAKKSLVGNLFNNILKSDKNVGRVVTSFDYQGNTQIESLFQNLTLEAPKPVPYRLTVEIEDLNTGEKTTKHRQFTLMSTDKVNTSAR